MSKVTSKVQQCEYCGKVFTAISSRAKKRKTCSQHCMSRLAFKKGVASGKIKIDEQLPNRRGLPTNSLAGSVERVEVYRQRLERGEDLFHPGDNPLVQLEEYRKGYRVPKFTVSVSISRAQMEAERVSEAS